MCMCMSTVLHLDCSMPMNHPCMLQDPFAPPAMRADWEGLHCGMRCVGEGVAEGVDLPGAELGLLLAAHAVKPTMVHLRRCMDYGVT